MASFEFSDTTRLFNALGPGPVLQLEAIDRALLIPFEHDPHSQPLYEELPAFHWAKRTLRLAWWLDEQPIFVEGDYENEAWLKLVGALAGSQLSNVHRDLLERLGHGLEFRPRRRFEAANIQIVGVA